MMEYLVRASCVIHILKRKESVMLCSLRHGGAMGIFCVTQLPSCRQGRKEGRAGTSHINVRYEYLDR